jgi:lycopene beta-cyclase
MGLIANLAPVVSTAEFEAPGVRQWTNELASDRISNYDLVILGGGCAGLSLAMRLAALGTRCPRTLVIEKRSAYTNDRTWCFWGESSKRVAHLVRHRWQRITLRDAGRLVAVDCTAMPYQMITAEAFYQDALRVIAESGRIDLATGVVLSSEPLKVGNEWKIATNQGVWNSAKVVDTRPPSQPEIGAALLWQSFYGCEIESDRELFDAGCAELMHFTPGPADRVNFNYLLPFSSRRALVEATVFGVQPVGRAQLERELRSALHRQTSDSGFRVLRTESGILPMGGLRPAKALGAAYAKAGLGAGAGRASTGYAFQRIQRWADHSAHVLSRGGLPLNHPSDPALLRALDYLFVSVLRSWPNAAPALFLELFERTDTLRLIRFLSDTGTIADYVAVAAALPASLFIREIPRALRRRFDELAGTIGR